MTIAKKYKGDDKMSEITCIVCDKCGTHNQYIWSKGIQYVCNNCHKEIDFLSAIFDNRVSTRNGILESGVKGKKKRK